MQYAWIYARSELPKGTKDDVKQRRGPSTRSQGILTYILPSRHFRNARCNFVQCPHLEALSLKCETEWEDALRGKHPKKKYFVKCCFGLTLTRGGEGADLPPPSRICVYACVYAYTRADFL